MRVFADTSFLLSSLISDGFSQRVFENILLNHQLVLSQRVRNELVGKLKNKFHVPNAAIDIFLQRMHGYEIIADSKEILYRLRDPNDDIILSTAILTGAEVIITGDKDLLTMNDKVQEINILNPREFWEKYNDL
ncbi:putative toxin-antitoxin system toxin component, PIN family [Ekhidna sp.]|uniref:putative toxin-antitoxin system toxin component, PIN family n=1 Tax=Ekhidna sp. TaxID=2608089 RepID=UPI003CCC3276